jgi:virginiamycin B lyase
MPGLGGPEQDIVKQPMSGAAIIARGLDADSSFDHIRLGKDGKLWYGLNVAALYGRVESHIGGPSIDLPFEFFPNDVAVLDDGNVYVTATGPGITSSDSVVFKISPTLGTILETFDMPPFSVPVGITVGPDDHLWIALKDANSIARLGRDGDLNIYPLPGGGGPFQITLGGDGALWFTEQNGNAIGRIQTNGSIAEYYVPTPNAGLFGITWTDGRVWFTEPDAAKIGWFQL